MPNNVELLPLCFHGLSDPIRLNIVEILAQQEMCVTDICKLLNLKQPKVSFHLKILRQSGIAKTRREKRSIYYCLNKNQFDILKQYLDLCQNSLLKTV